MWPDEDEPLRDADVVVVLAGGRGHRLDEALRLFRAGVGETLAISDGRASGWSEAKRLCRFARVVCFRSDPYSTRGEARWLAAQAERRDWDDAVVVTSDYHVRRTRMIFRRCFDGDLAVVGARPGAGHFAVGIAWEWPKGLYYLALERGC